jgi:hypothetical protein
LLIRAVKERGETAVAKEINNFRRIMSGANRYLIASLIAVAAFVFIAGLFGFRKVIADPDIAFLYSEHGAQWIRLLEPIALKAREPEMLISVFRTRFAVDSVPGDAIFCFRAMKLAGVLLNGKSISAPDPSLTNNWKQIRCLDLSSRLSPGFHEIRIVVQNQNGHPALMAYCPSLKIFTGEQWEASDDGNAWSKAVPVNKMDPLPLSRSFLRADRAFLGNLHIFIPIFILVVFFSLWFIRAAEKGHASLMPTASGLRWILMSLWVILALNNIGKIPLAIGMDVAEHMEYIRYIANNWNIPLATEGWQMFQPPFFYLISAVIYKIFAMFCTPETVERILRIIPLACGVLQVEVCYRTVGYVYPGRDDLKCIGTVIGGLLPMNIYISQFVGNEPLAGLLSSIAILLLTRILMSKAVPSKYDFVSVGVLLGLAVLTKMTALLVIFPVAIFLFHKMAMSDASRARGVANAIACTMLILLTAFAVSGWYFVRNWVEIGQAVIGGWDSARNIVWWQDPGYRTPAQLFSFGEALFYPIFSAVSSVWDGLYSTLWMDGYLSAYNRPPWNYGFFLSSAWLSLLPSSAIILGILMTLRGVNRERRPVLLLSVSCLIIYVSAILYLFLTVPILSTAKATYALGITPCLAVLGASGFEIVTQRPYLKAGMFGGIACWALAAYGAYFVL